MRQMKYMRFFFTIGCCLFCFLSLSVFAEYDWENGSYADSFFHPDVEGPAAQFSYKNGFYFQYHRNVLVISGYIQADARAFFSHSTAKSSFLIRRGRVNFEGRYEDAFRVFVSTNWTVPSVNLNKAYIDTMGPKYLRFTVGIFNEPFSLEALLPDEAVDFIERTPGNTNFVQTQDTGAMVYGSLFEDSLNYAAGIFNGTGHFPENNPNKEFVSRIVAAPFLHHDTIWKKMYIGASVSTSFQTTDLSDTDFQTGEGTKFWIWRKGVHRNAVQNRWGADVEWFYGPLCVRSEYLRVDWGEVEQDFPDGLKIQTPFSVRSGYIEATCLLTGETKVRNQLVTPFQEVQLDRCGWKGLGAWELVFRYDVLSLNPAALNRNLAIGTSLIQGVWIGMNWYLNALFLVQVDWAKYRFKQSFFVNDRKINGEDVLLIRVQGLF